MKRNKPNLRLINNRYLVFGLRSTRNAASSPYLRVSDGWNSTHTTSLAPDNREYVTVQYSADNVRE